MRPPRLSLNESLWVCGGARTQEILYPRAEIAALRERGAKVFLLNGTKDEKGLEELARLARQGDAHIVLMWLRPREMMALYPILRERKNFSVVLDDWWIYPPWITREADYIINRMYSGVAVRLGHSELVTAPPPLFSLSQTISPYGIASSLLRLPALAVWPVVDGYKSFQRRSERIQPERLLYLPFSVVSDSLPLMGEKIAFDFSITGSVTGTWLMRDPYASFKHTFANLYYDRKRLMDFIVRCDGNPFKTYDWRRLPDPRPPQSWDDYTRLTRQSRFVVATGGLHNAGLPKHLEYACLGTPMIGRKLPFEFPWLDDCLFHVDILNLESAKQIKPVLEEAMARYPALRENCLKWREQLFKLHRPHALFDMLQAQADGRPIPSGYLRSEVNRRIPVRGE
jgi:hypothetical protein